MIDSAIHKMKSALDSLLRKARLDIRIRRERPRWPGENMRLEYQERYVKFDLSPGDRVLDVGSGGFPFPYATILMDRFKSPTHRVERLVTEGKPFAIADIHDLPFADKKFDFVHCSHMLEFARDPLRACQEIMRVGKRGYIETPALSKDTLFAWARELRTKWYIVAIGNNLCFFEYSERQLEGVGSSLWKDLILARWYEPIQAIFYENLDLFNVMFTWVNEFSVLLFRLDGSISTLNVPRHVNSELSR